MTLGPKFSCCNKAAITLRRKRLKQLIPEGIECSGRFSKSENSRSSSNGTPILLWLLLGGCSFFHWCTHVWCIHWCSHWCIHWRLYWCIQWRIHGCLHWHLDVISCQSKVACKCSICHFLYHIGFWIWYMKVFASGKSFSIVASLENIKNA